MPATLTPGCENSIHASTSIITNSTPRTGQVVSHSTSFSIVLSSYRIGGAVVIASITSCTNTSNPNVMLAAGLLARKAVERGLKVKPHVKTSLAPGGPRGDRLSTADGPRQALDELGFQTVGYGCMTCIGNSGPLPEAVAKAVGEGQLVAAAVLSGNRNFEGRINPLVKANYLASPPPGRGLRPGPARSMSISARSRSAPARTGGPYS